MSTQTRYIWQTTVSRGTNIITWHWQMSFVLSQMYATSPTPPIVTLPSSVQSLLAFAHILHIPNKQHHGKDTMKTATTTKKYLAQCYRWSRNKKKKKHHPKWQKKKKTRKQKQSAHHVHCKKIKCSFAVFFLRFFLFFHCIVYNRAIAQRSGPHKNNNNDEESHEERARTKIELHFCVACQSQSHCCYQNIGRRKCKKHSISETKRTKTTTTTPQRHHHTDGQKKFAVFGKATCNCEECEIQKEKNSAWMCVSDRLGGSWLSVAANDYVKCVNA